MWPKIIEDVIGRPIAGVPALLKDVRRVQVRGEVYPAVVPSEGGAVEGVLYENLSRSEMDALDDFEGAEYDRRRVLLDVNGTDVSAETYFAADCSLLENTEWQPESLSADRLAGFRDTYKGWRDS